MTFTSLPPEEVERRRMVSVSALRERERQEWDHRYQEMCDTEYWTRGQCCAGCDFWSSEMAFSGRCSAAAPVSGEQVLASVGIVSCSLMPEPGHPFTRGQDWCGSFRDDFDWSSLDPEYLHRIGAIRDGTLRQKPTTPTTGAQR